MSGFVVVAFFTAGSPYAIEAAKLKASAVRVGVESIVAEVPNVGNWQANVQFKARFIRRMLDDERVAGRPIAYVDADAEFMRYPELFDRLSKLGTDLAVGLLDHRRFGLRRRDWDELVASTVWLANNDAARRIVDLWIGENDRNPLIWDQRNLQKILNEQRGWLRVRLLPEAYFKIFDTMAEVEDPVIVQHQKSRAYQRKVDRLFRQKIGRRPVITLSGRTGRRILDANAGR